VNAAELADLLRRKRLLIFDFDGTIADSSPLHSQAFNEAFERYGIAVDYDRIAGLTTEAAVEWICDEAGLSLNDEQKSALVLDKRRRARSLIENGLVPLEGSLEFLGAVRGRYALALCTSASRPTVEASLKRLGIADWFDSVCTAEDVSVGKPAPEAFLRALAQHDAQPGHALVFEDADSGMAAAAAAGVDAVRIVGRNPQGGEATWPILNDALGEVAAR
jgi:HAD superfamily hydrolase (TIGR01509 family)